MKILARLSINALGLLFVSYLIPGITVSSFSIALIVALILGLLNLIVRPVLIFFTLPINLLTLGLFIFVINAVLFWFVASFVQGFSVSGFGAAFFGALVVSVISYLGQRLVNGVDHHD